MKERSQYSSVLLSLSGTRTYEAQVAVTGELHGALVVCGNWKGAR